VLKISLYIFCLLGSVAGCTSSSKDEVLAEAYGNKLYSQELKKIVGKNLSQEDSAYITQEYINTWLTKQVLMHKADKVLSNQEKDKTAQIEAYRNDLLTYEVLNKLSEVELDTMFDETELEEYYNENLEDFELTQNILKINFFKVPQNAKNLEKLWTNFKAGEQSVYTKLKALSEQGGNYYTDIENWVFFDDILKEIPINTYNQDHYLNNNKYIRLNDGKYVYFIVILDFKIRSDKSPFLMERDNIKQLLLMQRQQTLKREIETKLLDDAYRNKEVKTF
jgi:hypothetical protein